MLPGTFSRQKQKDRLEITWTILSSYHWPRVLLAMEFQSHFRNYCVNVTNFQNNIPHFKKKQYDPQLKSNRSNSSLLEILEGQNPYSWVTWNICQKLFKTWSNEWRPTGLRWWFCPARDWEAWRSWLLSPPPQTASWTHSVLKTENSSC